MLSLVLTIMSGEIWREGVQDPQGHWQWVKGNEPFLRCGEQGSAGTVASILFLQQPHLKEKGGTCSNW